MKQRCRILAALAAAPLLGATARDFGVQVHQEIALLEFIGGGSPLTESERARAASIVREGDANAPADWDRVDRKSAGLLQSIEQGMDARTKARVRAVIRLNAAVGPKAGDTLADEDRQEAAIIAAHDPPVVWDAAHQRLISTVTVLAMLEADRAAAPMFGQPLPGEGAAARLAGTLQEKYPAMDDGMQALLARAEIDLPYALPALQGAPAPARARVMADLTQKIRAGADDDDRLLRLTQVLAGLGARGAAGAGGGGAGALPQFQLMQNQLLGASRSFSPRCNVYTGAAQANATFCHP